MKIWFDTEFYEDGRVIDLISIGMVREDGATYYAETYDALSVASRSEWLQANVFPHLTGPVRTRDEIRSEILAFAGEAPEFWAYYADYDWVVLCQLFGRMIDLPKGWPMFCRDLKQSAVMLGNPKLPEQSTAEHNALADALWAKEAWDFLNPAPEDRLGGISGLIERIADTQIWQDTYPDGPDVSDGRYRITPDDIRACRAALAASEGSTDA